MKNLTYVVAACVLPIGLSTSACAQSVAAQAQIRNAQRQAVGEDSG